MSCLKLIPVQVKSDISEFLYRHGIDCDLIEDDDGGADYHDLRYTARIGERVAKTSIAGALRAAAELGSGYAVSYVDNALEFHVRQPSERESYALMHAFRTMRTVVTDLVWPDWLIVGALLVGVALAVSGALHLHSLWHSHESAWKTPLDFAIDSGAVALTAASDLWFVTLPALAALVVVGLAALRMCARRRRRSR